MTEDYCTFEKVEKEKRGGGGGGKAVELHLSFELSGDLMRPADERSLSATKEDPCK